MLLSFYVYDPRHGVLSPPRMTGGMILMAVRQ